MLRSLVATWHGAQKEANMGSREEEVVRSLYNCYATGDRAALVDLYSDEAVYHVAAWHEQRDYWDSQELKGQLG
jgi:hypothetical protein